MLTRTKKFRLNTVMILFTTHSKNDVTSNNLTSNHWAYRKGHPTELLLVHLTEKWRKFVDSGLKVAVAFVDFKKAFYSVWHLHLLDKLHRQFGIDGQLYAYMKNSLSNRKQFTVINGRKSSKTQVRCGVPRCSVLDPTLFTLFYERSIIVDYIWRYVYVC